MSSHEHIHMAGTKSLPEPTSYRLLVWPLLVFLLLFGFSIYFSNDGSSFIVPIMQRTSTVSISGHAVAAGGSSDMKTCDLSNGTWVRDYRGPIYTNMTCSIMPDSNNCEKYGKDHDFVKWRWKPHGCHLPRFDPEQFLDTMRGMTLAFFGDSVSRNQKASLLCLLSQVESPNNTYSNSENELTKWHFETYNFTVIHAWSKFLVRTEERKVNGSETETETDMFLDEVDPYWVNQMHQANYVVLSGGHWFLRQLYLYEHNKIIGSVSKSDKGIPVLGMMFAYRSAFRTALNYLKYNAGTDLRLVVVRTFSPAHFESGAWNQGGLCERTRPNLGTGPLTGNHLEMRNVQLDETERARNGAGHVRFAAMDVTWAMEMRPDGHPGSHWDNRWNHGYSDCVHWCMPGAIDTWNEMLFQTIKNVGT